MNRWLAVAAAAALILGPAQGPVLGIPTARPLPGSKLSIDKAIQEEASFAAVCEAVGRLSVSLGGLAKGDTGAGSQEFKVVEVLFGKAEPVDRINLGYRLTGRPIGIHERVIWIGHTRNMISHGRLDGLKALPDTPQNRQAVNAAASQAATAWGQAVEGVQVRLRAEKPVWKATDIVTLTVEVRNGAKRTLFDTPGRSDIFNLEFDGQWYADLGKAEKRPVEIPAGRERDGFRVALYPESSWHRQAGPPSGRVELTTRLELTPGKHTVRVAFVGTLGARSEAAGGKPVCAVSNPVEIMILPPTPEPKTPDVAVDDENAVVALRKLGPAGARLTLDDQGRLKKIWLSPTRAAGPELALLKGLPKLEWLIIERLVMANPPEQIMMTEAELVHLKELKKLKRLMLSVDLTTDAGLVHLKGLAKLEYLHLNFTQVTDAGLAHLKGLAGLKSLNLRRTRISDAGLVHLRAMTNLRFVDLRDTGVTDDGLKKLQEALPTARLRLNGRVFEAGSKGDDGPNRDGHADDNADDPNAVAALRRFGSYGAHMTLDDQGRITRISLCPTWFTDAELAHLKGLPKLESLTILRHAKANPPREDKMTEAGLAHLAGLSNLKTLWLVIQVTDDGLAHLKGLTNLERLSLYHAPVTGAGFVHLKGLTKLTHLNLHGSQITDAGLEHLRGMTSLRAVDLSMTRVTHEGLKKLQEVLPNVRVTPDVKPDDRTPPADVGSSSSSSSSSRSLPQWGEAVEGVQVRLRAGQSQWNEGAVPRLWADVRNQGKRNLLVRTKFNRGDLEVDGRWYRQSQTRTTTSRPQPFPPGRQYQNIAVHLSGSWELAASQVVRAPWKTGPEQLGKLTPGKHTIRVTFTAGAAKNAPGKSVRAVSNPVEIEIVAKSDEKVDAAQQANANAPAAEPKLDGKEILDKLKSIDAVYAAAFTASGNRLGWPKKKWKLTMLDGEILYEEQVVEIPKPAKGMIGRFIPFRSTLYLGPTAQAKHDWVGRIRRYGPLDPWPENSPGPATCTNLTVLRPDASTYMLMINRPLLCLGRGYSKYISDIKEVVKQEDGRLKITADGVDFGSSERATWELVVDPDAAYMVRSARVVDNDKKYVSSFANSGVKKYDARCVPEKAECRGVFINASFEIQSASPEADMEFLRRAKAAMQPPYPVFTDVRDGRVSPKSYMSYEAGKLSPKGGKPGLDLDWEKEAASDMEEVHVQSPTVRRR